MVPNLKPVQQYYVAAINRLRQERIGKRLRNAAGIDSVSKELERPKVESRRFGKR